MQHITPTQQEKNEWSRMAQAAYLRGLNWTGHRYSAYASIARTAEIPIGVFDTLQHNYRQWLVFGRNKTRTLGEENESLLGPLV